MYNEVNMTPYYITAPIIIVGAIILIRLLLKAAGWPCSVCGEFTMTKFEELPQNQQDEIRTYFRQHERREFKEDHVFVCPTCHTVHDDFSGEKRSRELDAFGLEPCCKSFCKICGNLLVYTASPDAEVTCTHCETRQAWTSFGDSGLLFFAPPADAQLMEKPALQMIDA